MRRRIAGEGATVALRTDEELVLEVMEELGYERLGSRIDQAIRAAVARVRP